MNIRCWLLSILLCAVAPAWGQGIAGNGGTGIAGNTSGQAGSIAPGADLSSGNITPTGKSSPSTAANLAALVGSLQFGISQANLGNPGGTMSGYVAGDVITLACSGVTFSVAPKVGVAAVSGGAVTGSSVIIPGITSGYVGSGVANCTQASTTGVGTGYQVTVALAIIASYIQPASLGTGGGDNGNFYLNFGPNDGSLAWLNVGGEDTAFGDKSCSGLQGLSQFDVCIGYSAGGNGGTGATSSSDVYVGAEAGRNVQAASAVGFNTYVGAGVGRNTSSSFNTAVGAAALSNNNVNSPGVLNGYNITALGYAAGLNCTGCTGSLLLGTKAGSALTTGMNDVILQATPGTDNCSNGATESNTVAVCAGAGRLLTITGGATPSTSVTTISGSLVLGGTQTFASSTTGAGAQTFTNSPCSGLTTEKWIPVAITGQSGTWYVAACQ